MELAYLSCLGYFENTPECAQYCCRSERETLRAMLVAFSGHPAPLAETAPSAFQFWTELQFAGPHLSGISATTAALAKLRPAPNTFRCYASSCSAWEGRCGARLTLCRGWSASEWVCVASACVPWVLLKSHSSSWKAFPYPEPRLDGPMLSKPSRLRRCSSPTYTGPPSIISSDLITAIVWFSLLHPNICWAFLAQHGRALSWFTAYLVLTTSEIPAINMLPLESNPIAGVSAGCDYIHRLILISCQLIITANLCSFKIIYCHTD